MQITRIGKHRERNDLVAGNPPSVGADGGVPRETTRHAASGPILSRRP